MSPPFPLATTSISRRFLFDFTPLQLAIPLECQFASSFTSRTFLTSMSVRFLFYLIAVTLRFHSDVSSISFSSHVELTSISIRCHVDPTSISFQIHLQFTPYTYSFHSDFTWCPLGFISILRGTSNPHPFDFDCISI